jgi:hypothetical protein
MPSNDDQLLGSCISDSMTTHAIAWLFVRGNATGGKRYLFVHPLASRAAGKKERLLARRTVEGTTAVWRKERWDTYPTSFPPLGRVCHASPRTIGESCGPVFRLGVSLRRRYTSMTALSTRRPDRWTSMNLRSPGLQRPFDRTST